jgi:hypothetical protein
VIVSPGFLQVYGFDTKTKLEEQIDEESDETADTSNQ